MTSKICTFRSMRNSSSDSIHATHYEKSGSTRGQAAIPPPTKTSLLHPPVIYHRCAFCTDKKLWEKFELSVDFLIAAGSIFVRNGDGNNTPDVELGNFYYVPPSQHISSHQSFYSAVAKTGLRIRQKLWKNEPKVPPRHLVSVVVTATTGAIAINN